MNTIQTNNQPRRTNVRESNDEKTGSPRTEWVRGTCTCGSPIIANRTEVGVQFICWNTITGQGHKK